MTASEQVKTVPADGTGADGTGADGTGADGPPGVAAPASMDAVFQALGNGARRRMLDIVKGLPGCSVNDVCKYFEMSRIGVMKHLGVLERAGLVLSRKEGRTRSLYFNAVPIQLIYDRWTTEFSGFWAGQATDIKYLAESRHQRDSSSNEGA